MIYGKVHPPAQEGREEACREEACREEAVTVTTAKHKRGSATQGALDVSCLSIHLPHMTSMTPTPVPVCLKRERSTLPVYATQYSAGFDLCACNSVIIEPQESRIVNTGLVIQIPEGHFLAIFARSSLVLNKGLIVGNGVGVVDYDYRGKNDEIGIILRNITDKYVQIVPGERIAQGVLIPFTVASFVQVPLDAIGDSRGGFGSTGGYVDHVGVPACAQI